MSHKKSNTSLYVTHTILSKQKTCYLSMTNWLVLGTGAATFELVSLVFWMSFSAYKLKSNATRKYIALTAL